MSGYEIAGNFQSHIGVQWRARNFPHSLGETSVMITYIMIDYNDNKA
jgi:hypothetical protein